MTDPIGTDALLDRIEELETALKTERNKALREAAEIAHYMPIIGDDAERYADKVEEEIFALITDDQPTEKTYD